MILVPFYFIFLVRLFSIFISARNEKLLKRKGAKEYGKLNSLALVIFHFMFYGACLTEGFSKGAFFIDTVSISGLVIYALSILVLYYVIYQIRYIWTVKLIIAPKDFHVINTSFLFKYIRHPNYYLNIIPELIGICMIFHAWNTLFIGLPLYLVPLIIRIIQEERLMKTIFKDYR
jgi:isoprenylcysteine carboxyl methyltransferase (ICMT) family protein YpbQ